MVRCPWEFNVLIMSKFVVWVEFLVLPENEVAFRQRVLQQAQDSLREEADCLRFDVCIDPENNARVCLYEIYTDKAAFDTHLSSDHFKRFDSEVSDWVEAKSIRTLNLI